MCTCLTCIFLYRSVHQHLLTVLLPYLMLLIHGEFIKAIFNMLTYFKWIFVFNFKNRRRYKKV